MLAQSDAEENPTVELTPTIVPKMPWRLAFVRALPGYRLKVRFNDGLQGTVDMSALIRSPKAGVFARLADDAEFSKVRVEHGAVTWPAGLDLAPDAMHAAVKAHGEWKLS
jgi:hypothetical protein